MNNYDEDFFASNYDYSSPSAKEIVPILIQLFHPSSVVDLGTGKGVWLKTFKEHHVQRVMGYDGEYVDQEKMYIEKNEFKSVDLDSVYEVEGNYDIAMSLEVAEHLNEQSGVRLVEKLVNLSDIVFFSAAIPFQTGVNHINEREVSYWKDQFEQYGYSQFDVIRPLIWDNSNVAFWYKQNVMVYINDQSTEVKKRLENMESMKGRYIVHPDNQKLHIGRYSNIIHSLWLKKEFDLLESLLINPAYEDYFYLGRMYKEQGKYKMACEHLETYLKYSSVQFLESAYFHLGETYLSMDDLENAKKMYNECITHTAGEHKAAIEKLGHITNSLGKSQ